MKKHAKAIVAGIVVGLMFATVVAFAAWLVGGSGTTYSKAATLSALTTNVVAPTADLYPGADGGIYASIHNPNSVALVLTAATFGTVTSGDQVNCPASNLTTTNASGLSVSLPAGSDTAHTFASAAHLASGAPTACQGVSFSIAATFSASTP